MPEQSPSIEPIRRMLRHQLRLAAIDRATLQWMRNRIGRCVVTALYDEVHPLAKDVKELNTLARGLAHNDEPSVNESADNSSQGARPPKYHILFMPQPGTAASVLRKFWPTQLLLAEAGRSDDRDAVAGALGLNADRLTARVEEAAERQHGALVDGGASGAPAGCLGCA